MSDDKKTSQDSSTLSEWQKRHQEYEAKKNREENKEVKKVAKQPKKLKKRKIKRDHKKALKLEKAKSNEQGQPKKLGLSYLFLSLIVLVISLYFIIPMSSSKKITISGLQNESVEQLMEKSGINDSDYIISLLLHKKSFEKNIVNGSSWISDSEIHFTFPNEFVIDVKEHNIAAYAQTDNGYEPILSDGTQIHQQSAELPDTFTILNLNKESNNKKFISELEDIDQEIIDNIHIVTLVGGKTSKDLVQIEMYDGNIVLIPISDVAEKLGYYSLVASRVTSPTTIDMEVGIYTHAANQPTSEENAENQTQVDAENNTVEE